MIKIIFVSVMTFLSTASYADSARPLGGFIEPILLYDKGDVNVNFSQATGGLLSDSKESLSGFGLGARLGMHVYESIYVGLDGRYYSNKYDSSALGGSSTAAAYDLGLVAGISMPVTNDLSLRGWLSYIAAGESDPGDINGVDVKYTGLTGFRLGAGLLVSAISINLEYQDSKYSTAQVSAASIAFTAPDSIKPSEKKYIVSVSIPLGLF